MNSGIYNTNQTVILTTTNPDSIFTTYYTKDGTDPRSSSSRQVYRYPININQTTSLHYVAVDSANNWSPIYGGVYNINYPPVTVTVNIPGGLYNKSKIISLTSNYPAIIYYTTDGT